MTDELTPDERAWLRTLYKEELGVPFDDDIEIDADAVQIIADEDDAKTVFIPWSAFEGASEAFEGLMRRGLVIDGPQYRELTPAGRAAAQRLLL
jgi:hypothetical protein